MNKQVNDGVENENNCSLVQEERMNCSIIINSGRGANLLVDG